MLAIGSLQSRLPLRSPQTVALEVGSEAAVGSLVDISSHPPTINTLVTDSSVKPGASGIFSGVLFTALRRPAPPWQ